MMFRARPACAIFAMALLGCCVPSHAQTETSGFANSIRNRNYLEERWLGGSPEKLLEQFNDVFLFMPLTSVELVRKKALSLVERQSILDGIKDQRSVLNVQAPSPKDMRAQFDLLRTCLEEGIPEAFEREKLVALTDFIDTGVYRNFPAIRKVVKDWLLIAFQRQIGIGVPWYSDASDALLYKDKSRQERLTRLQNMYFAISEAGISLQAIHDALGAGIAFAVMGELRMMSEDLPAVLKAAGMSDTEIAVLESYSGDGVNGVYDRESSVFERCSKKPESWLSPLRAYVDGTVLAIRQFFEQNPQYLSAQQVPSSR